VRNRLFHDSKGLCFPLLLLLLPLLLLLKNPVMGSAGALACWAVPFSLQETENTQKYAGKAEGKKKTSFPPLNTNTLPFTPP